METNACGSLINATMQHTDSGPASFLYTIIIITAETKNIHVGSIEAVPCLDNFTFRPRLAQTNNIDPADH